MQLLTVLLTLCSAYVMGAVALALQRLWLHSLASIPGPRLAAMTTWYEVYYDMVHKGKFIFHIQELHKLYGPVVRIGPNEVHIADLDFLDTIYASNPHKRNKEPARNLDVPLFMAGTDDHDLHRLRRNALNPFFSKRAVTALEPMLHEGLRKVEAYLERCQKDGMPANLSDIFYGFAFDVDMRYCFGFDYDVLTNVRRAVELRRNFTELLLGVKFRSHFGWVLALSKKLPRVFAARLAPKGAYDMMKFSKNIGDLIEQVQHSEAGSKQRTIFHDILDDPSLPPSEKLPHRLQQEGAILILAGTESPAKSLGIIHYYLFANPSILDRVRSELRTIAYPPKLSELEQLSYLTGVIAEGNRLSFGLTKRNGRLSRHETLHCGPYVLPPNTLMSTTPFCVMTNEDVFPNPWEFQPERWLGPEGANARRHQFAFGRGSRKCLGISLAMAELYLAVATMARWDLELYKTDESDVKFQHDYQIAHGRLDSKGVRVIVKGNTMGA